MTTAPTPTVADLPLFLLASPTGTKVRCRVCGHGPGHGPGNPTIASAVNWQVPCVKGHEHTCKHGCGRVFSTLNGLATHERQPVCLPVPVMYTSDGTAYSRPHGRVEHNRSLASTQVPDPTETPEDAHMTVNARFYVVSTTKQAFDPDARLVLLQPVVRGEDNRDWAKATPSGKIEMQVNNPPAAQWFDERVGREVAITFADVESGAPGSGD